MASSSSSSYSNFGILRYRKEACKHRGCGRRTSVVISESPKNPGRLYYCCPEHNFSHWCSPIQGMEEQVQTEFEDTSPSPSPSEKNKVAVGVQDMKDGLIIKLLLVNLVLFALFMVCQIIVLLAK